MLHLASSHFQMVEAVKAQQRAARQEAVLRRLLDSSAFAVAERLSRLRMRAGVARERVGGLQGRHPARARRRLTTAVAVRACAGR